MKDNNIGVRHVDYFMGNQFIIIWKQQETGQFFRTADRDDPEQSKIFAIRTLGPINGKYADRFQV